MKIKARIWHKRRREFLENGGSLHCNDNWMISPFTGKVSNFVSSIAAPSSVSEDEDRGHYFEGKNVIKDSPYDICLFTGCLDYNGVEIYEGDFIEVYRKPTRNIGLIEVAWSEACNGWNFNPNRPFIDRIIVRGNKFENKENKEND